MFLYRYTQVFRIAVAPSCLGPLLPALVLPAVFLVVALRAPMLARPLMDA